MINQPTHLTIVESVTLRLEERSSHAAILRLGLSFDALNSSKPVSSTLVAACIYISTMLIFY